MMESFDQKSYVDTNLDGDNENPDGESDRGRTSQ